jgi:hypothetical protein
MSDDSQTPITDMQVKKMFDKSVKESLEENRSFLHQSNIIPQTIKSRHIDWNDINTTVRAEQRVCKLVTETVNNSDVLQNDNELFFEIGKNEIWEFRLVLISNSSAVADITAKWSAPIGTTGYWQQDDFGAAALAITGSFNFDGEGADAIAGFYGVFIAGTVAGTIHLQWAQDTAEASNTSVLRGSCIIAQRVN